MPDAAGAARPRRRPGSTRRTGYPLLRVVNRPRFTDHRHLDLAGVLQFTLHVTSDAMGEQGGAVVIHVLGLDDHADLAARLHRVDLLDAGVAAGDLLEVPQPLRVVLERLAAGA